MTHTPPSDPGTSPSGGQAASRPPTVIDFAPRRRRVTVLIGVLLGLAVALAAGAILVALDQREVAEAWREQAMTLEAQRDEVVADRAVVVARVEEALAVLAQSERDVRELEDRVRELAEEKARAEDTASTVQVERDVFFELSGLISGATTALDSCVTQLFDLQSASVQAFNRADEGLEVDVDALNARADRVTRFCDQARSAAAEAGAAADRLLRS